MKSHPPIQLIKKKSLSLMPWFRKLQSFWSHLPKIQILGFMVLLLINIRILSTPLLQRFDNIFYDAFFRYKASYKVHPAIVYIGIDEKTFRALKQFPWPRHYYADIARILKEWGAHSIAFDLFFSQPSVPVEDQALKVVFETMRNLYLPVSRIQSTPQEDYILEQPMTLIQPYSKAKTHVNFILDPDGIVRRILPYLEVSGIFYPHLGLQLAYDYLQIPVPPPDKIGLPRDPNDNLMIAWTGKWYKNFHYYSYSDITESYRQYSQGKKSLIVPKDIRGKICLIGNTGNDADIKPSPIEPQFPGIAIIAHVANSILTNQFIYPASYLANGLCLIAIVCIALWIFIPFRNLISLTGGLALGFFWILFSFILFAMTGLWLSVIHPILLILSLFVFSLILAKLNTDKEKEHFFKLSTRDGLTGLFLIRHFREVLNETVSYSRSLNTPFAILLIDVDDFKTINDRYGHQAGDAALKQVAHIILSSVRMRRKPQPDVTARYGGEEFIILLPDTNITTAAFTCAERVRKAIEKTPFTWKGHSLSITVSIGISVLRPHDKNGDAVIQRADEALYRAKREGKNRSCVEIIEK